MATTNMSHLRDGPIVSFDENRSSEPMSKEASLIKDKQQHVLPSRVSRILFWPRTLLNAFFLGDDEARYKIWEYTRRLPFPKKTQASVSEWTKIVLFPYSVLSFDKSSGTGMTSILFVSETIPFPDRNSGDQRLSHIIEAVEKNGFYITFASLTERGLSLRHSPDPRNFQRYEKALQSLGVHKICYGQGALVQELTHFPNQYRYAFVSFPHVATIAIPALRTLSPKTQVLYDMVDYHGMRLRREALLQQDASLLAKAVEIEKQENEHARHSDVTIAVSEDDRIELQKHVPEAKIEVLWDCFEIPVNGVPGPQGRNGILFVGGFTHKPNIDAVEWFVGEIFPLIRKKLPDVLFHIAGSKMPKKIREMEAQPGVVVCGWVPDLSDLFRTSRVFVAPLRYGAGVKGKIGQSLSFGLPVVTTSIGAEGMFLVPGVNAAVADDPKVFSDLVVHLLEDDGLWSALSRDGMDHVCQNWSTDSLRNRLKSLFSKLDNQLREGDSP